jgi:hypothetical protein
MIAKESIAWLLLAVLTVTGCGRSGPTRAAIEGQVTLGGKPLDAGRVLFVPVAPTTGPATSARITAGRYELSKSAGPVVGTNRVEIEADLPLGFALDDELAFAKRGPRPLPPNPIPPQFNTQSTLTVTVKADERNTFDVALPMSRSSTASRR